MITSQRAVLKHFLPTLMQKLQDGGSIGRANWGAGEMIAVWNCEAVAMAATLSCRF